MVTHFLDTSALAKLYVAEPGSERVSQLVLGAAPRSVAVSSLAAVEFRSAVRRRERTGEIASDQAATVPAQLEEHLRILFISQPVGDAVIEWAKDLIDRHLLRSYDAIQLASCLTLRELDADCGTMVCSDLRLLEASNLEGLESLNPSGDDAI